MVVVLLAVAPAYAQAPPAPALKAAPAPAPAPKLAPDAKPADAKPADPAPNGQPRTLPRASLQDVMPRTQPVPDKDQVTGGLSFGGGFAAGTIIVPPPHPDDQPWPKGMRIEPPDVNDPIAILPGMDGLTPAQLARPGAAAGPAPTWSQQFTEALYDGLGTALDLLLPNGA